MWAIYPPCPFEREILVSSRKLRSMGRNQIHDKAVLQGYIAANSNPQAARCANPLRMLLPIMVATLHLEWSHHPACRRPPHLSHGPRALLPPVEASCLVGTILFVDAWRCWSLWLEVSLPPPKYTITQTTQLVPLTPQTLFAHVP